MDRSLLFNAHRSAHFRRWTLALTGAALVLALTGVSMWLQRGDSGRIDTLARTGLRAAVEDVDPRRVHPPPSAERTEEAFAFLLEEARTDSIGHGIDEGTVQCPFYPCGGIPCDEPWAKLERVSSALMVEGGPNPDCRCATFCLLGRIADERGRRAFIEFSRRPSTSAFSRCETVGTIGISNRPDDIETLRLFATDPAHTGVDCLHQLTRGMSMLPPRRTQQDVLARAAGWDGRAAQMFGLSDRALRSLFSFGDDGLTSPRIAALRTIAGDRTLRSPDPARLRALRCTGEFSHEKRDPAFAAALASPRLVALSLLEDRALLANIAAERQESMFIRVWAKRMLDALDKTPRPEVGWYDETIICGEGVSLGH